MDSIWFKCDREVKHLRVEDNKVKYSIPKGYEVICDDSLFMIDLNIKNVTGSKNELALVNYADSLIIKELKLFINDNLIYDAKHADVARIEYDMCNTLRENCNMVIRRVPPDSMVRSEPTKNVKLVTMYRNVVTTNVAVLYRPLSDIPTMGRGSIIPGGNNIEFKIKQIENLSELFILPKGRIIININSIQLKIVIRQAQLINIPSTCVYPIVDIDIAQSKKYMGKKLQCANMGILYQIIIVIKVDNVRTMNNVNIIRVYMDDALIFVFTNTDRSSIGGLYLHMPDSYKKYFSSDAFINEGGTVGVYHKVSAVCNNMRLEVEFKSDKIKTSVTFIRYFKKEYGSYFKCPILKNSVVGDPAAPDLNNLAPYIPMDGVNILNYMRT